MLWTFHLWRAINIRSSEVGKVQLPTIDQQTRDLRKADGNPDGVVEGCELGIEDGDDVGSSLPLWSRKDTGHLSVIFGASTPPHLGSGHGDDKAHVEFVLPNLLLSTLSMSQTPAFGPTLISFNSSPWNPKEESTPIFFPPQTSAVIDMPSSHLS